MAVKIVTDSLGDIPSEIAEELGITIIPINVIFGNISYRDGADLTTEQFYDKLAHSKISPTTIVPPLGVFVDTFVKLAEESEEIVVITNSHKLSASYEAAVQAKVQMKRKCQVEVIDSLAAVMAQGLIVIAAAKAANAGASLKEVVDVTDNNIPRADVRMAFDTLEYLRRGGRIGKARTFLGTVLKVSPILGLRNGEVYPFAREHSRPKAIDYLYNFVTSFSHIDEMAVEDATTPDEADELAERLAGKFPEQRIYRAKVSPVVGAHVGPRVLGVAVLGNRG
jgi:DegV family protein with EDD domain